MDALKFLDAVAGFTEARRTTSANRPVRLAVVDPSYAGPPALPLVTFEGETTMSTKGYPYLWAPDAGDRVALVPVGGTYLIVGTIGRVFEDELPPDPGIPPEVPRGILGFADRRSNSSTTTSIVGVLQLDDVPLVSGRMYRIYTSNLQVTSSVGNGVTLTLRATTNGSTPTTGSTAIATQQVAIGNSGIYEPVVLSVNRVPSGAETLSVLLCVARTSGASGNAAVHGAATHPIQVMIEDVGISPGDTGVDI